MGSCVDLQTLQVHLRDWVAYLAEFFPGVLVRSTQARHHAHHKTPHHVVLQIPVKG